MQFPDCNEHITLPRRFRGLIRGAKDVHNPPSTQGVYVKFGFVNAGAQELALKPIP